MLKILTNNDNNYYLFWIYMLPPKQHINQTGDDTFELHKDDLGWKHTKDESVFTKKGVV